MSLRRGARAAALLILAPAALSACGAGAAAQVKLRVSPAGDTNGRLPCVLLVRKVDPKAYVADSYQSVASMVMTPDDSVVASTLVYPGTTQDLTLAPPAKGQLAVYVLFTYPSGDWKTLLPSSSGQVELKLSASRISAPVLH